MTEIELADGTVAKDPRLDRLTFFDPKSKEFPVRQVISDPTKLRSYSWRVGLHLDQGAEGACTGYAVSHELAARPFAQKGLTNQTARELYWQAQKDDPWPGGCVDEETQCLTSRGWLGPDDLQVGDENGYRRHAYTKHNDEFPLYAGRTD